MPNNLTPGLLGAVVAGSLLLASTTILLIAMTRVPGPALWRSVTAVPTVKLMFYGQAYVYCSLAATRKNALADCESKDCHVVTSLQRACAAFAMDFSNSAARAWSKSVRIRRRECRVARLLQARWQGLRGLRVFCDAKGEGSRRRFRMRRNPVEWFLVIAGFVAAISLRSAHCLPNGITATSPVMTTICLTGFGIASRCSSLAYVLGCDASFYII